MKTRFNPYLTLFIFLFVSIQLFAQTRSISGKITEKNNKTPIPGVAVYVEGSTIGATTNLEGYYTIPNAPQGNIIIVARMLGYNIVKHNLANDQQRNELNFQLSESFTEIEGVVVRGNSITGGHSGLNSIPGSAQYISIKQLEKHNYTDINRVLMKVPGINIQEEDGFGLRPNIGMRGTGVERSSKITLMEDGILIAPAPYTAPAAYYFPTAGRMQGVEVRKGSSQIKYGPYTTGGAINFISSQIPTGFGGKINLMGGNFGQRSLHTNIGQSFENFGFLFETFQIHSDGFKYLENDGNTGFDNRDYLLKFRVNTNKDAKMYQSLNIKLAQTKGFSNETYLGLTEDDFSTDPLLRYAGSQMDNIVSNQEQLNIQHIIGLSSKIDLTTTFYNNTFSRNWYKLDKLRFYDATNATSSIVGINDLLNTPNDFISSYNTLRGNGSDTLLVKANNRTYYSKGLQSIMGIGLNLGENIQNEIEVGLRIHRDGMDRFQWVDDYTMDQGNMELIQSGIPGTESNRLESARAVASFVQITSTWKKWTFTPGLRYEYVNLLKRDFGKSDIERLGTNLKITENQVDIIIPGIGMEYNINNYTTIFSGIHKGFTPPGATAGAKPEESTNYELGFRYVKPSINFNSVLFYNDYTNLLGSDLAATGGNGSALQYNGGKAVIMGLESELSINLIKGNKYITSAPFGLNYTYTNGSFRNSFESDFEPWGIVES
ncbi:MAG: TonB-dependent receptor, partial [Cyclobacteriaceae bacterium]|nr:TonB-dependent receptor [Cyclobacteriaceae bacterium]